MKNKKRHDGLMNIIISTIGICILNSFIEEKKKDGKFQREFSFYIIIIIKMINYEM